MARFMGADLTVLTPPTESVDAIQMACVKYNYFFLEVNAAFETKYVKDRDNILDSGCGAELSVLTVSFPLWKVCAL